MKSLRTSALEVDARVIKDSRGDDTVEATVRLGSHSGTASVPAGKTKGGDEAVAVPAAVAVTTVKETIASLLRSTDADLASHAGLLVAERALLERGGENRRDLGANAMLPVSIALWRCAASIAGTPLWRYIRTNEPELASTARVRLFSNVLNGGYHALKAGETLGKDRFDFQEMQIVPLSGATYRDSLAMAERVDRTLAASLTAKFGADRVGRADESGLTVRGLGDNAEALDLLVQAIRDCGFEPGRDMKITLDPASSHLQDKATKRYRVGGGTLSTKEYGDYLLSLLDRHPGAFASVEDPLEENDWSGLATLSREIKKRGVLVVGDDFYVTQRRRLERGIADGSANGLLVKPNQNGSFYDTIEVMKLARRNGIELVISHRSGETLDDTIADLAIAIGAHGIKTGAPQPPDVFRDPATWVRRKKYLRMIEIEESA